MSDTKSSEIKITSYSIVERDVVYCDWAHGLTMIIEKDGVKLTLNGSDLKKLVKKLPRTIGGRY